jgi:hypothetical protein
MVAGGSSFMENDGLAGLKPGHMMYSTNKPVPLIGTAELIYVHPHIVPFFAGYWQYASIPPSSPSYRLMVD